MAEENYEGKIGFYAKIKLKEALEKYAKTEGLTPSVVCRKALVEYLKKKKVLEEGGEYL